MFFWPRSSGVPQTHSIKEGSRNGSKENSRHGFLANLTWLVRLKRIPWVDGLLLAIRKKLWENYSTTNESPKEECIQLEQWCTASLQNLKNSYDDSPRVGYARFFKGIFSRNKCVRSWIGCRPYARREVDSIFKQNLVYSKSGQLNLQELMAIVITFQKWRHYLLGRHFKVWTDKKSLQFLTNQKVMG